MILNDSEIAERLESPLNLMNRLRRLTNNSSEVSPCIPPSSEQIIEDLKDKINSGSARSKATNIMISAMDELKTRLPEVRKPEDLARIASEMSKVVSNQSNAKKEDTSNKPQIIIYAPVQVNESHFETMTVNE